MNFIGIDLHTNNFTCCYRDENSSVENPVKKGNIKTFGLDEYGLAEFYKTLTKDTYVLMEATITTFSFVRLFKDKVAQVFIANTYELKQISLARCNTDKIDADKLCKIVKAQVLSGEQFISPVTLPPREIQELRGLFTSYRLFQKEKIQIKNRIHSLLKEDLHGYTQEYIFGKGDRKKIRELSFGTAMHFQVNLLLDKLERDEEDIEKLKDRILLHAAPFMRQIEILTSMKGISVFIAIAIITDIIDVSRFKNSKVFTSYLRSAPKVSNSNTSISIRGTNKKGRKVSATLLTQSLNHVLSVSHKLNKWYNRLCEYKKAGMVRSALRRRVFAEIYQMLKKGEYHYARDEKNHNAKMGQYKNFLEKQGSQAILIKIA